jgi:hypothetical protein
MTPELAVKIDAALAQHPLDGTWEALCVAAVRLGTAVAAFDRARADYVAAHAIERREAQTRRDQ